MDWVKASGRRNYKRIDRRKIGKTNITDAENRTIEAGIGVKVVKIKIRKNKIK